MRITGAPWGSLFRIQIFLLQITENVSCEGGGLACSTAEESWPWITHFKGPSYLLPPRLNRQLPLIRSPSPSFETAWEILGQLDGVWTVFWQETTWNRRSNESEVLFNLVKTGKFQQLQSGNLSPSATDAEARRCIIWRVGAGSLLWFVLTQCQLLKMFWSQLLY